MSNQLPQGWDESRIRDVIDHYENQSDEEAAHEDDRMLPSTNAVVEIPHDLLPLVREILAKRRAV